MLLAEQQALKVAISPVDMNTAAITGLRVALKEGDRCAIVLVMGASTAAVANFNLKQHNAASSGTSKALSVANPYYHKHGAATSFTKVVPGSATDAYDVSTLFAADAGILVFEVLAEQLDVDNGFAWISVDVDDSTAAKLISGLFVLSDVRHMPAYALSL